MSGMEMLADALIATTIDRLKKENKELKDELKLYREIESHKNRGFKDAINGYPFDPQGSLDYISSYREGIHSTTFKK